MSRTSPGTLFRIFDPGEGRAVMARHDGGEVVAVPGTVAELHDRHRAGAALPSGAVITDEETPSLLPPCDPTKIVCVGLNYRRHADEMDKSIPDEPLLFMKPPSALIGAGDAIELPPASELVHHEGELAVVIGRTLRRADAERARQAIFGYTCACDVTARDIQRRERRYTRAKGFDTFAPVGPAIALAPEFTPGDHRLTCRVDGEVRQTSPLDDFIFDVDEVLAFLSHVMTLEPGDLVLTGTPSGVGPLVDGDTVEVEIDGIGTLKNPVQSRSQSESKRW